MHRYVRTSRCNVRWCRAPHRPGDKPDHVVCLGAWDLGKVTVEVCVTRVDQDPPVVRIARHHAGGPRLERDLDTDLATELADILDLLTRGTYIEFSSVLRDAAAGAAAEASRENRAAP